jgi:hypothetical protein
VATEGLLAGVILSQEGVMEVLPGLMGMDMEGLESFANMIPPTVMVTVYIDVPPEIAGQRSEAVSQAFSSAYGVDLHQIMALEPPIPIGDEIELPPISIVLYQSTGDLRDLSETYLDQFLDNGGLAALIEEASANGRLVPGATPDSADGSVLLSGFVNVDLLLEYMPEEVMENVTAFIPKGISGLLGFAGGVSYWDRGVESEELGLDLLGLLGVRPGDGGQPEAHIFEDLDEDASQAEHDGGPEGGILGRADYDLRPPGGHLLDEDARDLGARDLGLHVLQYLVVALLDALSILDIH